MIYTVDREFHSDSSAISKVGVRPGCLFVEFASGELYCYYAVNTDGLFDEWFEADSAGRWYRDNLMGTDNDRLDGCDFTTELQCSYSIVDNTSTSGNFNQPYIATGELIDANGKRVVFQTTGSPSEDSAKALAKTSGNALGLKVSWVSVS